MRKKLRFQVMLGQEEREWLEAEAKKEDRSLSGLIRRLIVAEKQRRNAEVKHEKD
jgi:hypothetical protein